MGWRSATASSPPDAPSPGREGACSRGRTGDMHPQHTDSAWAASSLFGERVAHGMLVASFALGMLPLDPERVIALRRVRDAVFKRPVCLGDTIHVSGRVDRLDSVNAVSGI